MPHCGIGEWEIVGFATKRATTSYIFLTLLAIGAFSMFLSL
jgi:hypothetical protein